MAYTFNVVAWQDWKGRRFGGVPDSPDAARGLKVLVTNPDDPGDTHQFWGYSTVHFQDFSEWWVYIGGLMTMHGMDLADEPPDYEPPPDDDYEDKDYEEEESEEERHPIRDFISKTLRKLFRR